MAVEKTYFRNIKKRKSFTGAKLAFLIVRKKIFEQLRLYEDSQLVW